MRKGIYTTLFFIFFSTFIHAQTNSWLWAKGNGGVSSQNHCVSVDAIGNVFATGYFADSAAYFGSDTLYNVSNSGHPADIVIAKYDVNGNMLWAESGGGANEDIAYAVSADPNGNAFITGYFQSPILTLGSTILSNTGGNDMFIGKYDGNGNLLWAKSVGGANDDQGISVSADPSGNVFVTGYFQSPIITFGSITLTNADPSGNTYDFFIAKYDANGNVLWAKSVGGTDWDWSYSVCTDATGNAFVTGYFISPTIAFGSITLNYGGCQDMFIAKYDSNGNELWAKHAGANFGGVRAHSVSVDPNGNAYVTGEYGANTITFGSITLSNNWNDGNVFIVKYDSAGNVVWAKGAPGGPANSMRKNAGESVSADPVGHLFAIGLFESSSITFGNITVTNPNSNSPYNAMYIFEFDSLGNALCGKALLGGGCDYSSVCSDPFGSAFIGTAFGINPFVVGSDTLAAANGTFFTARYNCLCTPFLSITGDQSICKGETTTLSANGASNYVWLPSNTTGDSIVVSPLATTTYSVISTAPSGCVDTTAITVNVSVCAGIFPVGYTSNGISVFPSPASDFIIIQLDDINEKTFKIKIVDMLGQTVIEKIEDNISGKFKKQIDVTSLIPGMYIIIVSVGEKEFEQKIIVQH